SSLVFYLILRRAPRSALFPYTTLFRSTRWGGERGSADAGDDRRCGPVDGVHEPEAAADELPRGDEPPAGRGNPDQESYHENSYCPSYPTCRRGVSGRRPPRGSAP